MERNWSRERAYMDTLTEELASEDFAQSDPQLPSLLRKMAEEQVRLRKFRNAIHLRRAAQLLEGDPPPPNPGQAKLRT